MINKTLQSFTIQKKLGAGGMATVYLAENNIGKKAAIKVLHTKYFHDAHVKQRFVQEAKVMAQLHHPNICSVISMEETSEFAAIIMEYLEGQDLSDYISKHGAIEEAKALDWLQQIVPALDYAHSCGMVHRDIKPSNFFVTTSGQIKVMDFGIAKAQDSLISTHTNSRMGSVAYMSPEQIKSPKYVTHKTDIYSLGVTLHHLLAGKIPYDTTTQSEYTVMEKIIKEPLPVLSCSDQLNQLIQVATQKDPKKRPESLANWLVYKDESNYKAPEKEKPQPNDDETIIDSNKDSDKGKTPPPQGKTQPIPPKPKKNKWLIPMVAVFGVILLVIGYFIIKPDTITEREQPNLQLYEKEGVYGYKLGDSIAIPASFTTAKAFKDGQAEVSRNDSVFTVNDKGEIIKLLNQEELIEIAKAKKEEEKAEKDRLASEKADTDVYTKAKRSNTKTAYQNYLDQYPNGKYRNQAQEAIKLIDQAEKDRLAEAERQRKAQEQANSLKTKTLKGVKMIKIPGKNYYMSETEITRGQFEKFINATGYQTTAEKEGNSWVYDGSWEEKDGVNWRHNVSGNGQQPSSHPVIHVSWYDAKAYAEWLGGRLLTESEWEHAAKGEQNYDYAGSNNINEVAWYDGNSGDKTHAVKGKKPNGYGLYDMSGNVLEWTATASGSYRVLRGGCWYYSAEYCRVAYRSGLSPSRRGSRNGFRLAF